MRVIVCGGGQVGYYLAKFLASDNDDVTIIDSDPEHVERAINNLDVRGVVGSSTHPEVLVLAGARNADLIIAVTARDEVNILTCLIASTAFNIPMKIARVRERSYLRSSNLLFEGEMCLPLDVVISPEVEVARSLELICRYTVSVEVYKLADETVTVLRVRCQADAPVVNTHLKHIHNLFPHIEMMVALLIRDGKQLFPDEEDMLQVGDELYVVCDTTQADHVLSAFGVQKSFQKKILIIGGGSIGTALAEILKDQPQTKISIIELDSARATTIAGELPDATVLRGNALDVDLLKEAAIESIDHVIAVTDDEKTNILSALLSKSLGAKWSTALVNTFSSGDLVMPLGIDSIVLPRSITVSSILRHIYQGHIRAVYSICDGASTLFDIEVPATSNIVGGLVGELALAEEGRIVAIVRGGEVHIAHTSLFVQAHDRLIVMAAAEAAKKLESMLLMQ